MIFRREGRPGKRYDAYEEYKKNNPPLLDDKGNEIIFKKVE